VNALELARIISGVKNLCPAQKWEEGTPDMWEKVLAGTNFTDAKDAVVELGKHQSFIAPGEIREKALRLRQDRVAHVPMPVPNHTPGVSEGDEIRAIERAIGNGLISSVAEAYAYERWGGSLHLAQLRGHMPQLEGPAPVGNPKAVEDFIAGTFPRRPELPREIAEVLARRRPPGTAIACPTCHAAPNRRCHAPATRRHPAGRELAHAHPSRLETWAVAQVACPTCSSPVGAVCTEYGRPYVNGAHRERIEAATN